MRFALGEGRNPPAWKIFRNWRASCCRHRLGDRAPIRSPTISSAGFATTRPAREISFRLRIPRTQVIGPNPSTHYAEQMNALDLAKLGPAAKRTAVEKALEAAKIDRIPQRPNGKHVAADLLAYFYGSADGEDFLYGVAIKRDDCRGLADSGKRPARLT